MTSISTVTTSVSVSVTASSTAANATTATSSSSSISNDQPGITARGKAYLDQMESLLMDTQNKYSMSQKADFYNGMADAWNSDTGWMNDAEKQQAQQIIQAASQVGPNGFLQQVAAYENQKTQYFQQNPFESDSAALSWLQSRPAWQQELDQGQILDTQINMSLTQQLQGQNGIDGFNYPQDVKVSTTSNFSNIKNPIARQLLQLMGSYTASENLPTYSQKISAAQQILSTLTEMSNGGPIDTVNLSPHARSYLGAQQGSA